MLEEAGGVAVAAVEVGQLRFLDRGGDRDLQGAAGQVELVEGDLADGDRVVSLLGAHRRVASITGGELDLHQPAAQLVAGDVASPIHLAVAGVGLREGREVAGTRETADLEVGGDELVVAVEVAGPLPFRGGRRGLVEEVVDDPPAVVGRLLPQLVEGGLHPDRAEHLARAPRVVGGVLGVEVAADEDRSLGRESGDEVLHLLQASPVEPLPFGLVGPVLGRVDHVVQRDHRDLAQLTDQPTGAGVAVGAGALQGHPGRAAVVVPLLRAAGDHLDAAGVDLGPPVDAPHDGTAVGAAVGRAVEPVAVAPELVVGAPADLVEGDQVGTEADGLVEVGVERRQREADLDVRLGETNGALAGERDRLGCAALLLQAVGGSGGEGDHHDGHEQGRQHEERHDRSADPPPIASLLHLVTPASARFRSPGSLRRLSLCGGLSDGCLYGVVGVGEIHLDRVQDGPDLVGGLADQPQRPALALHRPASDEVLGHRAEAEHGVELAGDADLLAVQDLHVGQVQQVLGDGGGLGADVAGR